MIRLIATDVDGTLIGHDAILPDARRDAVRELTAAGVPLIMATGKIWPSIRPLWELLELPGPHVTCNGAAVVTSDGTIHLLEPLADSVADEVAATLAARAIPYVVYLEDGTLVTSVLSAAHDVITALGEPAPSIRGRDGRRVLKVLAIVDTATEGDLRSVARDAARIQRSGHRFLEWNSPTVDKATGLRFAAAMLGIDLADTVAVGDAPNDIPMLLAAGTGVAVASADEATVEAADLHLSSDLADFLLEVARAHRTVST
jgi:Cof subfamily protein (haloacid dehalogenase superfamily)